MYGTTRHLQGCHIEHCSCAKRIRARGGYINAALLAVIALLIGWQAYERYHEPQEVISTAMTFAALVGGAMNLWQHQVLHGHGKEITRYGRVLKICVAIFLMELGVGIWSGSLSLVSDSWHVFIDGGAALVSIRVASLVEEGGDRDHVTHDSMNAHILGDLLQSVAVVIAGLWIYATGQYVVDTILSAVIAVVLLGWSAKIAHDSRRGSFGEHHHH
ncbi:hypothetical protein KW797_03070 [Candidatus Parcubacteria bacterium]|nr:hypothetical protein [Candidatus Parcubacteria bacterium]